MVEDRRKFIARDHSPGHSHEDIENVKLERCHLDWSPSHENFPAVWLQLDIANLDRRIYRNWPLSSSPQHGSDSGEQFMRSQRLRNIVVGACVQTSYAIAFVVACRQHDYGHRAPLSQPLQNMKSIQDREHDVE